MKGKLITFEGSEGSGKSTQIELIRQYLLKKKVSVLFVREPGGVVISEKIRAILLDVKNKGMNGTCEMLLYMAARAQLVEEVIAPALVAGQIVLCDRFLDSTVAYQGYGNGMDLKVIRSVGKLVTGGIVPDLTIVFDIDAAKGLSRIKRKKDRIESRSLSYHNKVRRGYQAIACKEPRRVTMVDVADTKENIHLKVRAVVDPLLGL